MAFQNLGLVVVDEEQRLGVGQKEKLKVGVWFVYLGVCVRVRLTHPIHPWSATP